MTYDEYLGVDTARVPEFLEKVKDALLDAALAVDALLDAGAVTPSTFDEAIGAVQKLADILSTYDQSNYGP